MNERWQKDNLDNAALMRPAPRWWRECRNDETGVTGWFDVTIPGWTYTGAKPIYGYPCFDRAPEHEGYTDLDCVELGIRVESVLPYEEAH